MHLNYPFLSFLNFRSKLREYRESIYGSLIAFSIISIWTGSELTLLSLDLEKVPFWLTLLAVPGITFLYTGLFITAHDAMHGSICPSHRKINNWIGTLSLQLYGCFSYRSLLQKHRSHHRHPASEADPDFHDQQHCDLFSWYLYFMKGYFSIQQLISITLVYSFLGQVIHFNILNLILFWVIPPIASSFQLFYFGTFLPHREPETGYITPHCAQTIARSTFWSFITCYHFGYHLEHHRQPHVPWWRLPQVYHRQSTEPASGFSNGNGCSKASSPS